MRCIILWVKCENCTTCKDHSLHEQKYLIVNLKFLIADLILQCLHFTHAMLKSQETVKKNCRDCESKFKPAIVICKQLDSRKVP